MPLKKTNLSAPKTSTKLAALTAAVLLAHGALLIGTPVVMAAYSPDAAASFSTRIMTLQPADGLPHPATHQPTDENLQRPAQSVRPAKSVTGALKHPVTAPATLRDDVDPGPSPTVVADAPPLPDATPPAVPQLLGADSPPANLSSAAVAALVAGQEDMKLAQAVIPAATASAQARATAKTVQSYAFPAPVHLKYTINGEIRGFPAYLKGDLQWKHDGKAYEARLEISHFLLGSRVQTSRGELGPQGLEPIRFGDKRGPEVAAHFDRTKGRVTFSANTPDGVLLPGTQDQLSALVQLAAMLGGSPASFPEGTAIPVDAVGPRSMESWVFKVGTLENLALPGGPVAAIKLTRDAVGAYGTRGEVWLAPSMGYLPVRVRLTETNGDVMDQRWSETVAP